MIQLKSGDLLKLRIGHTHRFSCCDCGLTHDFHLVDAVVDHGVMSIRVRITGNKRSTAAARRGVALRERIMKLWHSVLR